MEAFPECLGTFNCSTIESSQFQDLNVSSHGTRAMQCLTLLEEHICRWP